MIKITPLSQAKKSNKLKELGLKYLEKIKSIQ